MDEPERHPCTQPFGVEVERTEVTALVKVRGELDILTAPQLREALEDVLSQGVRHVALDLRELEFIDSTGLRVVYDLDQLARQDGFNAAVVRGRPAVHRAFEVAGLGERFVYVDQPGDLSPPGD